MSSEAITRNDLTAILNAVLPTPSLTDFFYPIGSYYETSDTSFDPNVSWGGTWTLETEGQVHISGSANGTYQVSGALTDTTDGGEATHLLTAAESGLPSHAHSFKDFWNNVRIGSGSYSANLACYSGSGATYGTNNAGGSNATSAHNNMQPYIIVNRWHRTA